MKTYSRRNKGTACIMAVIFVTLFSVLAISFTAMSNTNLKTARNLQVSAAAQATAESGLEYARWLINDYIYNSKPSTFGTALTDDDKVALFEEMTYHIQVNMSDAETIQWAHVTTPETGKFSDAKGTHLVVPLVQIPSSQPCQFSLRFSQYDDSLDEVEVVSEGRAANIGRKVSLRFNIHKDLPHLFDFAIYAEESMALNQGVSVSGYNFKPGEHPLKIGTNSTSIWAIEVNSDAIVDGDAEVGVGGDPETVIYMGDGSNITGEKMVMPEEWLPPPIEVPSVLSDSVSQGTINGSATLVTGGKYDSISLGKEQILTIDGPVELYVTGDITMGQLAAIQINEANPNAYLKLFLGGDLKGERGATLNTAVQDASKLMILGLDTCQSFELDNSGAIWASIYVPQAVTNFNHLVELHGAIISRTFAQNQAADFHYDARLRDVNSAGIRSFILVYPDGNSYVEL